MYFTMNKSCVIFSIYIDCTENIYPCVYLKTSDYCLGTLHDSTQAIVDTSKILFGTRIPIAGSNCDGCYLWPYCNGGCIGIAYSYYGIAKPGFDPRCGRFNKDR